MNKVVLGKYVNTHGLKGEIRIKSSFKYKDKVFQINNEIIIDSKTYKIMSYRVHKDYDMVTLEGINSIEEIPFMKNTKVYIDRDRYLNNNEYLDSDLIGFTVKSKYLNKKLTSINYITKTKKLLECEDSLVPYELITNIDFDNKIITIKDVKGL